MLNVYVGFRLDLDALTNLTCMTIACVKLSSFYLISCVLMISRLLIDADRL